MLRIYYSNDEYELGKHKILTTYTDRSPGAMPEDAALLSNYSVLEVEERYNPNWDKFYHFHGEEDILNLPDRFYVDNSGQLRDEFDNLVDVYPNPQRESYKLSQLYGLTQEQLATYIDNNVTNLAQAKEFLKKLAAVTLWLVKQTKLDQ